MWFLISNVLFYQFMMASDLRERGEKTKEVGGSKPVSSDTGNGRRGSSSTAVDPL
jgi:hypothetical protein